MKPFSLTVVVLWEPGEGEARPDEKLFHPPCGSAKHLQDAGITASALPSI